MTPHPFLRPLLATEHTEHDDGAERVAFALAARCNLGLRVVMPVTSNPEYEAIAPLLAAQIEREAAIKLDAIRVQAETAGVAVETCARRGEEPWHEIVGETRVSGADLLITRRRGRRGMLANLLVGEMVTKVAGHAPCSVLMVPEAAQIWSKRVLAAIDGSPVSVGVARVAAGVAAACGLPLTLLSVQLNSGDEIDEQWLRKAQEQALARIRVDHPQLAVECRVAVSRSHHEGILTESARAEADLLVLGKRGNTALEREMLGRTASRVTGLSEGAVLLVQP
jgi:nucleotide-binding universal stress UspA family protein